MTAQEYWDGPGIRFLNEDGTLPTVEERVKAGYCAGWHAGWDEAWDTRDEQDKHRCNPEAGFLRQEVSLLKAEIERLRAIVENKMDRKTPSREWHIKNRKFPLK